MGIDDIPNVEQLSDLERLRLAEELIASVKDPSLLPVPLAHRFELEHRWATYEANPESGLTQEQFWSKIRFHSVS